MADNTSERLAGPMQIRLVGVSLMALVLFLSYLLVWLWPSQQDLQKVDFSTKAPQAEGAAKMPGAAPTVPGAPGQKSAQDTQVPAALGATQTPPLADQPGGDGSDVKGGKPSKPCLTLDQRLILLVMVAGALGSFVHIATSFADFVGNEKFIRSWAWWYLLKPFTSMALATVFYLVIRGGLLAPAADGGTINLYGIVSMAAMVGMFSKQATTKLSEVFDTLFKSSSGGDLERKDQLNHANGNSPDGTAQIPPDEVEQADASEIAATTTSANPAPAPTPDDALPGSKGGVA